MLCLHKEWYSMHPFKSLNFFFGISSGMYKPLRCRPTIGKHYPIRNHQSLPKDKSSTFYPCLGDCYSHLQTIPTKIAIKFLNCLCGITTREL